MKQFFLKKLSETDLPLICEWLKRPHIAKHWSSPSAEQEVIAKYSNYIHSKTILPFLVHSNERPVGYVQAYQQKENPHYYGIDGYIADEALLRRGLGSEILKEFISFLFENYDISKITADPSQNNISAIRLCEKLGFSRHGLIQNEDGTAICFALKKSDRAP